MDYIAWKFQSCKFYCVFSKFNVAFADTQQDESLPPRSSKSPKRRKGSSASNKSLQSATEGTSIAEVNLPGGRSAEPSEAQFRDIRLDDADSSVEKRHSKDSKHNRSKSTGGTVSPVNSQKSNGKCAVAFGFAISKLFVYYWLGLADIYHWYASIDICRILTDT